MKISLSDNYNNNKKAPAFGNYSVFYCDKAKFASRGIKRIFRSQENNPVKIFVFGGGSYVEKQKLCARIIQDYVGGWVYRIKENWFERLISPSHKAFLRRCRRIANKLEKIYDYKATPTCSNQYSHSGFSPKRIYNNIVPRY